MHKTVNILLYGLGSIGKSYLKGLIKSNLKINLYTYDIKKTPIKFILRKKKKFEFYKIKNLPKKIDLCIISTTSKNKIQQVKNIFNIQTQKI